MTYHILFQVIVLEASSRVGGWVHSVRHDDGSVFELGPRSIRPVGLPGFNTLCLVRSLFLRLNKKLYNTCKCPKILYTKASDKIAYANSADSSQTAPVAV